MTERQLPFDEEAEIAVLGACLQDEKAIASSLEFLTANDFYLESHRLCFQAVEQLFARSIDADPVAVLSELDSFGAVERFGGKTYIGELLDAVPTAANVGHHIRLVKDASLRRKLIQAGNEVVKLGYEKDGRSAAEVIDRASQRIYEVAARESAGLVSIRQAMKPAFALIDSYQQNTSGITGVGSGLYDVDELTGGWQKGNLVVVAARPGMGKTALTTGLALHAALERRIPTALFSLEMTNEEIVQRMLCHLAGADLGAMLRGRLSDEDSANIVLVAGRLNTAPIWVDDSSALTVTQVRAKARRLKAEQPDLGLVIVDYLQLMTAEGENRTQEVSAISRGLKALAKDLRLPVIALSQLSRQPENRSDHRPQLSDLRESGSIEQDSDLVCFLYRPEKYYGPTDSKGNDLRGKAEFIVSKQRNGPTGNVRLYFRDYCARFENAERRN